MIRFFTTLFLCLSFYPLMNASEIFISSHESEGSFPIVGSEGVQAIFVVDEDDAEVVTTAAEAVIGDIKLITGKNLKLMNSP